MDTSKKGRRIDAILAGAGSSWLAVTIPEQVPESGPKP